MEKRLLSILCCPATHKGLGLASAALLADVNSAIASGGVHNRDGKALTSPLAAALVTDDGKLLYPVNDGIPVLLEGESVMLDQVDARP